LAMAEARVAQIPALTFCPSSASTPTSTSHRLELARVRKVVDLQRGRLGSFLAFAAHRRG
jgi:hypothetical protein